MIISLIFYLLNLAFGSEIEVPTIEDKVKLKIPKETQTGKMFRLRGKGEQGTLLRQLEEKKLPVPLNIVQKKQVYLTVLKNSLMT